MAEAGGGFVTRSFERMLKDAPGKKYSNLQNALKAYLGRCTLLSSQLMSFESPIIFDTVPSITLPQCL